MASWQLNVILDAPFNIRMPQDDQKQLLAAQLQQTLSQNLLFINKKTLKTYSCVDSQQFSLDQIDLAFNPSSINP